MKKFLPYLCGFMGMLVFILIYGLKVLDPTYTDWLLQRGGDLSQHYLGWVAFKNAEWNFPIGSFNNLTYPHNISIIFTDSIPVFAVFFKLFRNILPQNFQYWGFWGLLCFGLQGYFSALILKKYLGSISVLIGSLFFICSPVMLYRLYGHEALAGQWIIIAALYLLMNYNQSDNLIKVSILWYLLGMISGGIHIYFVPMCGIINMGYFIIDVFKRREIKSAVIYPLVFIFGSICSIFVLGGFSSWGSSFSSSLLGEASFNLNGFFNPIGNSSCILKGLPYYGIYGDEGFAYLGGGTILLGILLFFMKLKFNKKVFDTPFCIGVTVIILTSLLVALSNKIAVGNHVILEIPLPNVMHRAWSVFRSCGRLIWPAYYLILVLILCAGSRYFKSQYYCGILLVVAFLQIYDLHLMMAAKSSYQVSVVYNSLLKDPIWKDIGGEGDKIQHIVFDSSCDLSPEEYYAFADFALSHGMTLNDFWVAHKSSTVQSVNICADDCIYIFENKDNRISVKINSQNTDLYLTSEQYWVGWMDR